ncbi:MAG: hypothetical protein HQ518_16160 [Rhodopirellula sp.]|nr:hypothetical protein [Rhodopirellula sp.]
MTALADPTAILQPSTKTLDEVLSTVRESNSKKVSWHQWGGLLNNRRSHRVTFQETLHVVGIEMDSVTGKFVPVTDSMTARGRDISVDGISFQHADPLPHRYVAVSFQSPSGTERLIARLSWCRFACKDQYVSGGRRILDGQLDVDWDSIPTV